MMLDEPSRLHPSGCQQTRGKRDRDVVCRSLSKYVGEDRSRIAPEGDSRNLFSDCKKISFEYCSEVVPAVLHCLGPGGL
jgi:hypothetical protein